MRIKALVVIAIVAHAFSATGALTNPPALNISLALQGRAVYVKNCATCHGLNGNGGGEMGLSVRPRPRNFRSGVFKFRSTPSGSLPTNEDLARVIRQGLAGTAMPSFSNLREREIRAVAEYIKTFSHRWDESANHAAPLPIPEEPRWFAQTRARAEAIGRGKVRFVTACAPCHGVKGDGKGAVVLSLEASEEEAMAPSDLRKSLRCGTAPADVYRLLVTGMDGTSMPGFASSFSETELWELVAYVLSLKEGAN